MPRYATNIVAIIVVKLDEIAMGYKDDFEFLNSDLWLNYTQQRYLSPEEIRYRQSQLQKKPTDWPNTAKRIVATRKTGAITLFLDTIGARFWFYPADVIQKKIDEIEKVGSGLYEQINRNSFFKQDFLLDSKIEEAITSAIYEGANSTRAKAEQLIASGKRPANKDEWMLVNNFKAMKWVHENKEKPLSKDIILQLHKIVTDNTLEHDDINFAGKLRNDRVFVTSLDEIKHEGVEHSKLEECLDEMISITTNNKRYLHPLIKSILIHYFIAYIHPFFDGNGRTARALFYFKSMCHRLNYVELLSVSAYLKEHGKQYEKSFEKVVSNDFDVTYFVDFCLDSMIAALKQVSRKVAYLLNMNELKDQFGLSPNQIGLVQRMALHKFRSVSIEEYAAQISKSRELARQELKQLLELGLVDEHKVSKKLVYTINADKLKALYGASSRGK